MLSRSLHFWHRHFQTHSLWGPMGIEDNFQGPATSPKCTSRFNWNHSPLQAFTVSPVPWLVMLSDPSEEQSGKTALFSPKMLALIISPQESKPVSRCANSSGISFIWVVLFGFFIFSWSPFFPGNIVKYKCIMLTLTARQRPNNDNMHLDLCQLSL